jgi:hypothetical protein
MAGIPTSGLSATRAPLVEWSLVQRELSLRREVELAHAAERAVAEPPAHVLEALGPRPQRAGRERDGWHALARDLERFRLEHAVDVDRDGPLGPRERGPGTDPAYAEVRGELAARVQAWRAEHGLPSEPERGLATTPEAVELDLDA